MAAFTQWASPNFTFLPPLGSLLYRPVAEKLLQEEYRSHLHRYGELVCQVSSNESYFVNFFPCGYFHVALVDTKANELTKELKSQQNRASMIEFAHPKFVLSVTPEIKLEL